MWELENYEKKRIIRSKTVGLWPHWLDLCRTPNYRNNSLQPMMLRNFRSVRVIWRVSKNTYGDCVQLGLSNFARQDVRNHTNPPPPHMWLQAGVLNQIPMLLSADVVQVHRALWIFSNVVAADVIKTIISPSGTVRRSCGWWWSWSRLSCLPVVADIIGRCFKVIRR